MTSPTLEALFHKLIDAEEEATLTAMEFFTEGLERIMRHRATANMHITNMMCATDFEPDGEPTPNRDELRKAAAEMAHSQAAAMARDIAAAAARRNPAPDLRTFDSVPDSTPRRHAPSQRKGTYGPGAETTDEYSPLFPPGFEFPKEAVAKAFSELDCEVCDVEPTEFKMAYTTIDPAAPCGEFTVVFNPMGSFDVSDEFIEECRDKFVAAMESKILEETDDAEYDAAGNLAITSCEDQRAGNVIGLHYQGTDGLRRCLVTAGAYTGWICRHTSVGWVTEEMTPLAGEPGKKITPLAWED